MHAIVIDHQRRLINYEILNDIQYYECHKGKPINGDKILARNLSLNLTKRSQTRPFCQ